MPITTPSTTGPSYSGTSHGPYATGGGGGGGSPMPAPKPQPKPVPSEQVFRIVCTGMKPNTVHTFYYEGVDLGSKCRPITRGGPLGSISNRLGDPLKTDETGRIEFDFHFTGQTEQKVDFTNKVRYELAGDKKFELKAADSSASKIVPMKRTFR